ncbi:hypothetical protein D3C71_1493620 [compost metagenome]
MRLVGIARVQCHVLPARRLAGCLTGLARSREGGFSPRQPAQPPQRLPRPGAGVALQAAQAAPEAIRRSVRLQLVQPAGSRSQHPQRSGLRLALAGGELLQQRHSRGVVLRKPHLFAQGHPTGREHVLGRQHAVHQGADVQAREAVESLGVKHHPECADRPRVARDPRPRLGPQQQGGRQGLRRPQIGAHALGIPLQKPRDTAVHRRRIAVKAALFLKGRRGVLGDVRADAARQRCGRQRHGGKGELEADAHGRVS